MKNEMELMLEELFEDVKCEISMDDQATQDQLDVEMYEAFEMYEG